MSNEIPESVQLFFKSFQKHLLILRDGEDKGNQSFRANILVSQLRQFEKAVAELAHNSGHAGEEEHEFLQHLLAIRNLGDLFDWIRQTKIAPVDALFYRQSEGNWDLIFGEQDFHPIRVKEWIDRGSLACLEWEDEALVAFAFAQPRIVLSFAKNKEGNPAQRMQLGRLVSKLLPLFLTAPITNKATVPGTVTGLIAKDRKVLELLTLIGKAAVTDVSILLEGESGTGKEVIANYIHACSPRSNKPMVAVNCAAIPAGLMESELFGHEKGSFTGAHNRHIGQVEQANGGTLFLDEIGEMDLPMQAKLLRFLQLKEFHRVGGKQKVSVDVRIVAATNRDLKEQVAESNFREDLYYRLSVMPFRVPALRERVADILPLTHYFLEKYTKVFGFDSPEIDPLVFNALSGYDFPGNVRELENLVQNVLVVSQGKKVRPIHLPEHIRSIEPNGETVAKTNVPGQRTFRVTTQYNQVFKGLRKNDSSLVKNHEQSQLPFTNEIPKDNDELKDYKAQIQKYASHLTLEIEKRFLNHLLERADGSMPKASRIAGINRTLLYKMLERTKQIPE